MKLSIIVPVYNAYDYLDECLFSIINQKYKNIEIVIINDGSLDDSWKIIDKYQKKYPKIIKAISQENKGQAYSRNKGIELASGELITFVDSDDYIKDDMYVEMINILEKEKTDMIICDFILKNENGEEKYHDVTSFDNLFSGSASLCNKIFKKSLIDDIRFIEGIWYEDYNFYINICLKKPKYSLCKKGYYVYRLHEGSTMHNNNSTKNLDIITATEDIVKKCNDKELIETIIIDHILIEAINRVYEQNSDNKKEVVKKLNKYVHNNIKNIFKTTGFKNSSFNRKIVLLLNYCGLVCISNFLLNIKK